VSAEVTSAASIGVLVGIAGRRGSLWALRVPSGFPPTPKGRSPQNALSRPGGASVLRPFRASG
jgi:hypothetical protein